MERVTHLGSQFWFYRTQAGAEIDLIVDRGEERIGYEFKCSVSVSRKDASGLKMGLADGIITRGHVVYAGEREFPLADHIQAQPAGVQFLGGG